MRRKRNCMIIKLKFFFSSFKLTARDVCCHSLIVNKSYHLHKSTSHVHWRRKMSKKSGHTFIVRCRKTNTPYMRSFVWLCLITSTIFLLLQQLINVTYAVCYLHIKQIAISQERRAIWKNYRWSSFVISRVLSNKTNLIFISYTL